MTPFDNFHQVAYVTNDVRKAVDEFRNQFGVSRFLTMRDVQLDLTDGTQAQLHVALAFAGPLQLEVIEPVGGQVGPAGHPEKLKSSRQRASATALLCR